jgi:hypothetical protein
MNSSQSKLKSISIRVQYQPHPDLTLEDPGTRQINLRVTSPQYWGMLLMSYALFGGNDQHIQFWERRPPKGPLEGPSEPSWRPMKLAYLNSMIGPYVIAQDNVYRTDRPVNNWSEYVATFKHNKSFCPSDFTEYTAHFIGRSDVIVRFSDVEFLKGAILICLWFNLKVSEYIYHLRFNWNPLTISLPDILAPTNFVIPVIPTANWTTSVESENLSNLLPKDDPDSKPKSLPN